jgi:hypothetical protein
MPHEMTTPKRNAASDDPSALSPHDRLRELTSILANGIHRLRAIAPAVPECGQIPSESSSTGLEGVSSTRPYGTGRQPERTLES